MSPYSKHPWDQKNIRYLEWVVYFMKYKIWAFKTIIFLMQFQLSRG
jgi:hypothetical protein